MSQKFENEIFNSLNTFRQNPKSIKHQIEVLAKGISRLKPNDPFLKEIDKFVPTLERLPKMSPLKLNQTLNQIALAEVKKYSRNESSYNPYLTGNQLKGIVPDQFLSQNVGLLADSGADEAITVVPKLLLNKLDKDKKGRKMITTPEYTQVGIASTEFERENYYVIIFANNDVNIKKNQKDENEKEKGKKSTSKNGIKTNIKKDEINKEKINLSTKNKKSKEDEKSPKKSIKKLKLEEEKKSNKSLISLSSVIGSSSSFSSFSSLSTKAFCSFFFFTPLANC